MARYRTYKQARQQAEANMLTFGKDYGVFRDTSGRYNAGPLAAMSAKLQVSCMCIYHAPQQSK